MKTNLKLFLSLLGILSLTVGCITLGAKKGAQSEVESTAAELKVATASDSATTYKTVDEYLKRVGSTCPKVLENMSQNPNPNRFSYMLDTTDTPACRAARSMEDLIGQGRLFELSKYNEIKQDREGKYHQYHKGILVEDTEIRLREKTRTGKIYKIKGGYYPSLDVDTTGLISLEEAKKVAFKASGTPYPNADIDRNFQIFPPKLFIRTGINKIIYSFFIPSIFPDKPRVYEVDALTGKLFQAHKSTYVNACYKCDGGNTSTVSCPDYCSPNIFCNFEEYQIVETPTVYYGCQSIRADKCTPAIGTGGYRISPEQDSSFHVTDSINIYDISKIAPNGDFIYSKIYFCYDDGILSKQVANAASLYYAFEQTKSYFNAKNINNQQRLRIGSNASFANQNVGQWDWVYNTFDFGVGINYNSFSSIDIVAHEYGHYMLHNFFNVNRDNNPQHHETHAIHEGVADIFSVLARRYLNPTASVDWTIGYNVALTSTGTYGYFPRSVAHPENTFPSQALYYNDTQEGLWDPDSQKIYNHAGIIAKWFYLLTNGGTGSHFPVDNVIVSGVGIDLAEQVVIQGLTKLRNDTITTPTYEEFAKATVDVAPFITDVCNLKQSVVRAWKAVGLLLNEPEDRLAAVSASCHVDLYMCDNHWDIGK